MVNASLLFLALLLCGCAHSNVRHYWFSTADINTTTIDQVLAAQPLAIGQNISVINLGFAESASHHLVQVRHAEPLHIHHHHDLSVWIYRGRGRIQVGTNVFEVSTGDSAYIPRTIAHRFINDDNSPAVAIVIFSPALYGTDCELVEKDKKRFRSCTPRRWGWGTPLKNVQAPESLNCS
ncbi:MAG: hypothetical protein PCFJNLEI_03416 [Verrucomicrobiae bacterium]|nr:hypothetical protein [Verrucomicrobiae bacterium]